MSRPLFKYELPEVIAIVKEYFLKEPLPAVAKRIGFSEAVVRRCAESLGIERPQEFIEQMKQIGRFKKGHISGYVPPKGTRSSPETEFGKGHKPHNTKAVGTLSIRNDVVGIRYVYIKIADGDWRLLHRMIWEQHHGPIPEGMIITFKDGDTLNLSVDNLQMISRKEHYVRNRENSDKMMAFYIAGGKRSDKETIELIMQHPELIALKKAQLQLKKRIKDETRRSSNG